MVRSIEDRARPGVVHVGGDVWMCVRERESVLLCSDGWEKHKEKARREEQGDKILCLPEEVTLCCSCWLYPALGRALEPPQ